MIFLSPVTSKLDRWPWKTIELSYSSFVLHFIAIYQFKWSYRLETSNLGQNQRFLSRVTLKFDGWPWKTIGHLFYATSSFVYHFIAFCEIKWSYSLDAPNLGQNRQFFVPCDLEIWQMTLKNNRAPLLFYLKLSASFYSHLWIQNGVTVRKLSTLVKISNFFVPCDFEIWRMTLKNNRAPLLCYFKLCVSFHRLLWNQNEFTVRKHQIWVKIGNFLSCVTLKFDRWPWKTIGHLFYSTSSLVHHFIAICEFKMELQSGNAQFGSKSGIFCPVWPWNLKDDL